MLRQMALLLALATIAVAVALMVSLGSQRRASLRQRAQAVALPYVTDTLDPAQPFKEIERLNREPGHEPGRSWRQRLGRPVAGLLAALPPAAAKFVLLAFLGMTLMTALALRRFELLPAALVPLPALAAGLLAAVVTFRHLIEQQRLAFIDQFPDAVDLVVRATRAGIPLAEAIRSVAAEAGEPVRSEFKTMADGLGLGIDYQRVFQAAAARVRLVDFQFFLICLTIQRETGGPVADTLASLSQVLRQRKELRDKVKALTAEPRLSAGLIAAIPLVAGVILSFVSPATIAFLFDDPDGRNIFLLALTLSGVGLVLTRILMTFRGR